MGAAFRASSVKVEKKHLLGQECKSGKRRGRAPTCNKLSKRTYQKLVARSAVRMQVAVKAQCLGKSKKEQLRFSRMMAAFSVSRWKKRDQKGKVVMTGAVGNGKKKNVRPSRAYDTFVSDKFVELGGTGSFAEKRARVGAAYKNISQEVKAVYSGTAQQRTDQSKGLDGKSLPEFVASNATNRGINRKRDNTLKRNALLETVERMKNHAVFRSGLQIGCLPSGIKPELIRTETDSIIAAWACQIFEFDGDNG